MTISTDGLAFIRDFLKRKSAIVVDGGKDYLIESRLLPVARREGASDIDELVLLLRRDESSELARRVIEAMTTNETSFFRDIHPWETLRTMLLPSLIKERSDSLKLNIWCAAASTGQEPYTIAMILREHFPELSSWRVQIIATDINATVLERAREGIYSQAEVNRGLPAPLLLKYFDRRGADWQIRPDLRQMVSFQELNLVGRWSLFAPQDLVFMRNVLIYFDVPTKREILARTREHMNPGAYLILGGAETTINLDDHYSPVRTGSTLVYQSFVTGKQKVAYAAG